MKTGLRLALLLLLAFSALPAFAFDDDSTDDTRSLLEIRTICGNGRTVLDTDLNKFSCAGDEVYLNQLESGLFKNGEEITHERVLDFKVSRGGAVYYLTEIGPYLHDEGGRLNSNGGTVVLFLVSSSGDVVYLNDRGDVFKNGREINRGPARVRIESVEISFLSERIDLILNPAVARNGKAIYINEGGQLFVDGDRINPLTSNNLLAFKINSTGDVYYLDDQNRLFRNKVRLFDGRFRVIEFQLSNVGEVAYLTDGISKNLYLEDHPLSAGATRVVSFRFNSRGEIVYQDALGRTWKNGRRLDR